MAETTTKAKQPSKRGKPNGDVKTNGMAGAPPEAKPDSELIVKLAEMRSQVRDRFGKMVMATMALPRYRHLPISDLQHFVLKPLIRDRVAMAYPADQEQNSLMDISSMALWASESEDVDAKITDQINGGVFPLRLGPDDWHSREINLLRDVIAPDQNSTLSVISNFGQVVTGGSLKLPPLITRLVDEETLEKMGAERMGGEAVKEAT